MCVWCEVGVTFPALLVETALSPLFFPGPFGLTGHTCLGFLPGSPRPFCSDFCGETVSLHSPSEPHHLIQQLCCLVVTHSVIPYIILGFCQCGLVGTCLSLGVKSHSYCDCPHCPGSCHCEFLWLASVSFHLAGIS